MAHTSCCTESLSVSLVLPKIQSFPWGLAESVVVEWVMCWSNWGLGKGRIYRLAPDPLTGQKAGLTSDLLLLPMVPSIPSAALKLGLCSGILTGLQWEPLVLWVLWASHEKCLALPLESRVLGSREAYWYLFMVRHQEDHGRKA